MKIVIVNYGLGNIFSIHRAINFLGYHAVISGDPEEIRSSDRIILPGVGAFGDGMQALKKKKLDDVLKECAVENKPMLGICLGMQLFLSSSEEFGLNEGLGLIPGSVKRLPSPHPAGLQYKIPHVGWSQVFPKADGDKLNVFTEVPEKTFMYFVHSFHVVPENDEYVLAHSVYGGFEFCCAVRRGSVRGVQFHPELSGKAGLKIYEQFLR